MEAIAIPGRYWHRFGVQYATACALALGAVAASPSVARAQGENPWPAGVTIARGTHWSRAELCELARQAVATHSTAFIVVEDGRTLLESADGSATRPVHVMSVTKSIASLAVGRMLRDGPLASVDTALHWFFPEWRQGRKRLVTLRHVLAHTSGLQDVPNAGQEVEPSPDVVRLALAAELVSDPGSTFAYNNKAANLLAAVVERVTGTDIERYLEQTVFADLGIGDVRWIRDPAGTPYTMAGLHLSVRDLARIGQMLIDGGRANGRQVIDSAYAREAFQAQQPSPPPRGLMWWLVDGGVQANGWLGQWLVILPGSRTIAARLIDRGAHTGSSDDFGEFVRMVLEAVKASR